MKTVTFLKNAEWKLGVSTARGILDIEKAVQSSSQSANSHYPVTIAQLISGGEEAKSEIMEIVELSLNSDQKDLFLDEKDLKLGASVLGPEKIICVGLNYKRHAEESNMPLPEKPILFNKFNNALCGHEEKIPLPNIAKEFDYEGELAIVIGKETKDVSKDDALNFVYGYTVANDFSARDLQFQSGQWMLGKTSDNFCPLGPYLISADEIKDPNNLNIKTYVNGEERQNSSTSDMIFHCDEIISFVSKHMTLNPGDIILTGTPEGVIMGYEEDKRQWLTAGDEIVIEIENLGELRNELVAESSH